MHLTISQFIEHLRTSGVLVQEEVDGLVKRIPVAKRGFPAERITVKLIESKRLTFFQATEILEGRGEVTTQ